MVPQNPGISKTDTQKSGSNSQKSTQNNGTSPYHDIFKLPLPPRGDVVDRIRAPYLFHFET